MEVDAKEGQIYPSLFNFTAMDGDLFELPAIEICIYFFQFLTINLHQSWQIFLVFQGG